MLKIALLLLCSLCFPFGSYARLGESEKAIISRYGQPIEKGPGFGERHKVRRFRSNGFVIQVSFLDGVSQGEIIERQGSSGMKAEEAFTIVSANQRKGLSWKLAKRDPQMNVTVWKLGSYASAIHSGRGLMIETETMRAFRHSVENNRLKTF